jgi:hypothetical protein
MWLCHRLYICHIYFATFFFWRGTYRADMLHGIVHSYCIKNLFLKTKRNLKIDSNSKSYLENLSNFKPSWSIHLISQFWVFTLFRNLMEVCTASIFRVFLDFASIKLKFRSQQSTSFSSNKKFQQPPTIFRDHNSWIVSPIVAHE